MSHLVALDVIRHLRPCCISPHFILDREKTYWTAWRDPSIEVKVNWRHIDDFQ